MFRVDLFPVYKHKIKHVEVEVFDEFASRPLFLEGLFIMGYLKVTGWEGVVYLYGMSYKSYII